MPKRAHEGPAEGEAKRAALEQLQGEASGAGAQDENDDEMDDSGIPRGWQECPSMGRPVDRFIPMKVPLGARYEGFIAPHRRFTIDDAVARARDMVKGMTHDVWVQPPADARPGPGGQLPQPELAKVPVEVGLVIDLTKSSRYYDARRWQELGVQYIKIPCQGRGQAPQPENVSDMCWEVYNYLQQSPHGMVLIHCTHGFNRTGYMIVSFLARVRNYNLTKALQAFSKNRPPGIYKHYYIKELFKYYHERLPSGFPFPKQPPWKAGDSPEHEEVQDDGVDEEEEIKHDDRIGEGVDVPEAHMLQQRLMDAILGPDDNRRRLWLPGSQPVSLDASNISLLRERPYWVTWKADGTRYMVILLRWGTYLVDRKFSITRVQMRWPTPHQPGQQLKGPVGPMHHWTVLDGEMIVDEVLEEGRKLRRFLAYDMVMLNGQPVVHMPWKERWKLIKEFVIEPRRVERHQIASGKWQFPYQYEKEAFSVRRKDFWPLAQARKVVYGFSQNLTHETDGLIFQGAQDPYVPGTCHELLKWKYANLNSADFRLRIHPQEGMLLELLETRKPPPPGTHRGYRPLPGARVAFPEGVDPSIYDMHIIECSWDPEAQVWIFMRERKDKDLANAYHVFESVWRSIQDKIEEEELLQYIDEALQLPLYNEDCGRLPHQQQQQPQPPHQQGQPQQQQPQQSQQQPQQQPHPPQPGPVG